MRFFSLAIAALSLTLAACDSTDEPVLTTVTATVVADAQLSTLEAAVIRANLADALAGTGPFTVFAPTDAAFQALLTQLDATPEQLLARQDLAQILQLHVVAGSTVRSTALRAGQAVATLNGRSLTVVAVSGGFGLDANGDGTADARIVTADIDASNGIVHKIDRVLL